MNHIEQLGSAALSLRNTSSVNADLSIPGHRRSALSAEEWGEVQAIVHTLDEAGYSPEQAALVERARDEFPTLVTGMGLMAQSLLEKLIEKLSGTYDDLTEELWREIGKQQAELGYFTAPMLERLQIEQVIICYLQWVQTQDYYLEVIDSTEGTLAASAALERRLNAVQARYNRASEALARLRRLTAPGPLQINIGGQQVNVAGGNLPPFS